MHLHVREDDGTPSGRPELFQDVISRIRAGSDLITMVSTGRLQRHDDRGAHDRPDRRARPVGRRVGIDELRRRHVHHAAAGRARDHRAGHRGGHRARGRGVRRRPRRHRGPLAGGGRDPGAAADQPRVRSPGRDRRLARGADRDAPAAAAGDVLDRDLRRTPPPADAGAGAALRRARASAPGSRTPSTSAAECWRRPTPRWSAPPIELAHAVGREVATQEQTRALLGLAPAE